MVRGIMWARCSFGMILHRDNRQSFVPHPFDALVIEIDVRDLDLRRQRLGFHREPVIM